MVPLRRSPKCFVEFIKITFNIATAENVCEYQRYMRDSVVAIVTPRVLSRHKIVLYKCR